MRRLTGLDAQFLAGENGATTSHAIGLILYEAGEPRLDAATVRRLLSARIHEPTPLRWRSRSTTPPPTPSRCGRCSACWSTTSSAVAARRRAESAASPHRAPASTSP